MPRILIAACAALAALVAPGVATAQKCVAPPGTAAIENYCETIPAAGGDRDSGDPDAPAPDVSPQTSQALAQTGDDGKALAQALGGDDSSGTTGSNTGDGGSGNGGSGNGGNGSGSDGGSSLTIPVPKAPSSNPLNAVTQATGQGTGIGQGFVIVLVAATLVLGGAGWMAYRRRETS
jgi:hypothetical protein